jgi:hypothetical protein
VPRVLTDNDFRQAITRGLARIVGDLDALTLREARLAEADDPDVLRFAAAQSRMLLTHDVNTMPDEVYALSAAGQPVPRVALVPQDMPVGRAVEDLAILLSVSTDQDWQQLLFWLPL